MDRNEAQQKLADELVAGPREKAYGHPKDNYRRIAHIWSAVLGIEVTPVQAVLCELGVKFSRLIQTPDHEDTQVDIKGYIRVLQRLLDPEDRPSTETLTAKVTWVKKDAPPYKIKPLSQEDLASLGDKDLYVHGAKGSKIKIWSGDGPDEPTAFTAEPPPAGKEVSRVSYRRDEMPVDLVEREYPDGSKEMTFEEACGEKATERGPEPMFQDGYDSRGTGLADPKNRRNLCGQ